jgi:hypothetical protein
MKGDFTRFTFDRTRHDVAVLMQQGRVQLDADWNEQGAIDRHLRETTGRDVIGPAGAPKQGGGFAIGLTADARDLTIGAGRFYIDGGLLTNEAEAALTRQPHLWPAASGFSGFAMPAATGRYLAYLLGFDWHVTAAEDPAIRETALGGPDTATRLRGAWQVRLEPVAATALPPAFDAGWRPAGSATTGRLAISTGAVGQAGACLLPPTASYRALENQLYRVEVHRSGDRDGAVPATFKWSRDNGAVVTTVSRSGQVLMAADLGRDEVLGFHPGQWVELVDRRMEMWERHGRMLLIEAVDPATRAITIAAATPVPAVDGTWPVILRRWDQSGAAAGDQGIPMTSATVPLEQGLEASFAAGSYRAGEWWVVPARTAISVETGVVEWPRDGAGNPAFLRPQNGPDRTCPLALVDFDTGTSRFALVGDCRPRFPALTALEAADVGFDDRVCALGGAATVQQALDMLCARNGTDCTLLLGPGDDLQALVATLPAGAHARLCFRVGDYALPAPLRLEGLGHVLLQGGGPGTRLVAAGAEIALVATGCASLTLKDCALVAGTAGFGAAGLPALNGALTAIDCPEVSLEGVHLRNAAGPLRSSSCVTIRHAGATGNGSVARIRGCRLEVARGQVGLLAIGVARLTVEDNVLLAQPTAAVPDARQDPHYAGRLRRVLLRNLGTAASVPDTNAQVSHNNQIVRFRTDPSLIFVPPGNNAWQQLVTRENPPVRTALELAAFLKRAAARIVQKGDAVEGRFATLLGRIATEEGTAMAQGIVVGGERALEVRITGNSILGAVQGVHIGLSRRDLPGRSVLFTDWLHVEGNVMELRLSATTFGERHGIFIGNCRSLQVENNRVSVTRDARSGDRRIEAIVVHGAVERRMVVRHNHISGATVGVALRPLGTAFARPQWIVTDNLATSAATVVTIEPDNLRSLVRGLADNFA